MSNPPPLVDTADHHGGRRAVEEQGSEVGRVTFLHFFSMLPSYHGSHDDPAQWHPKRYEKRERRNTRAQNVTEGRKGCGNDWRQRQIKRKRKKRKKKVMREMMEGKKCQRRKRRPTCLYMHK
ncbi:hypothetical protein LI328DRAFT_170444 [Trichoderma asperelloides]|nr:hypothetical protein LI328DRAFT_170444 [Trichoderma asperelloides]